MAGGDTKQRINDLEYENAVLRETVARLSVKPTLRDRFAMAALTGIIASNQFRHHETVHISYRVADAMMEVRDEK